MAIGSSQNTSSHSPIVNQRDCVADSVSLITICLVISVRLMIIVVMVDIQIFNFDEGTHAS